MKRLFIILAACLSTRIPQGRLPTSSMLGTNSWGKAEWGGPAPPSGTHHYVFKLYALKEPVDFTFAVKASRFITHIKKLTDPEVHVARFLTYVAELREDDKHIRAWRAEGKDVHVYFNNDSEGHAVRDAYKLGKLL